MDEEPLGPMVAMSRNLSHRYPLTLYESRRLQWKLSQEDCQQVFRIIQSIWPNQQYRDKFEHESDTNLDFFVRFIALLLKDIF
jgi:hypothetical protein